MSYSGYPLQYRVHDMFNHIMRKRRLLEEHNFHKTINGKYADNHGTLIDPKQHTYKELKAFLEKE